MTSKAPVRVITVTTGKHDAYDHAGALRADGAHVTACHVQGRVYEVKVWRERTVCRVCATTRDVPHKAPWMCKPCAKATREHERNDKEAAARMARAHGWA